MPASKNVDKVALPNATAPSAASNPVNTMDTHLPEQNTAAMFDGMPPPPVPQSAALPPPPPPTPFTPSPGTHSPATKRAEMIAFIRQQVAALPADVSFMSFTPSTAAISPAKTGVYHDDSKEHRNVMHAGNSVDAHSRDDAYPKTHSPSLLATNPAQFVGVSAPALSTNTTGIRKGPPPPLGFLRPRGYKAGRVEHSESDWETMGSEVPGGSTADEEYTSAEDGSRWGSGSGATSCRSGCPGYLEPSLISSDIGVSPPVRAALASSALPSRAVSPSPLFGPASGTAASGTAVCDASAASPASSPVVFRGPLPAELKRLSLEPSARDSATGDQGREI